MLNKILLDAHRQSYKQHLQDIAKDGRLPHERALRRERSARVWQALQCWAEIIRLGTQPLEVALRDDIPVVLGHEEWPSFAAYRLTLLRRARSAHAWQALQCWLLIVGIDEDIGKHEGCSLQRLGGIASWPRRPSP